MIQISQQDFENKVKQIIEGKTTRTKLIKELKIDRVTLNNRIQELFAYNPELYIEFITKFPYTPREYTHINWRAMLIDIMKKGYTKFEAEEQYGISSRTIARKVYEVEKEDEDISNLYREVSYYRKHKKKLPSQLQEVVDNLSEEEIFIGSVYDEREAELLKKEKEYQSKLLEGKRPMQASRECEMGRGKKTLSTLYRIEIEKSILNNTQSRKKTEKYREER